MKAIDPTGGSSNIAAQVLFEQGAGVVHENGRRSFARFRIRPGDIHCFRFSRPGAIIISIGCAGLSCMEHRRMSKESVVYMRGCI